jgi:hypothetical protein
MSEEELMLRSQVLNMIVSIDAKHTFTMNENELRDAWSVCAFNFERYMEFLRTRALMAAWEKPESYAEPAD